MPEACPSFDVQFYHCFFQVQMEKFAVDLDKVLDEFELNEGECLIFAPKLTFQFFNNCAAFLQLNKCSAILRNSFL